MLDNKKLHLEHPEDSVIYGHEEIKKILQLLEDIFQQFFGLNFPNPKLIMQYKVDGSPNLVFGTNPENGRFFVGTKSVFAKNPKINYSHQDIDQNYQFSSYEGLVDVLKIALEYLPELNLKGVYSGDVMFTCNTIEQKIINDSFHTFTFKPNIIRYSRVNGNIPNYNHKIGIFLHTKYNGDTLNNLEASYVLESPCIDSKNVWVSDAEFIPEYNELKWPYNRDFNDWFNYSNVLLEELNSKISLSKTLQNYMKLFLNYRVRQNLPFFEDHIVFHFIEFIKKRGDNDLVVEMIEENRVDFEYYFKFISAINQAKICLLSIVPLGKLNQFKLFFDTPDGCIPTEPEGLVVMDKKTGFSCKLVNRHIFSRQNFLEHSC